MAVYVDEAWLRRGRRWAHLMADTVDELHGMAARLGLPPHAYHPEPSGVHYDIADDVRSHAIELGAIALTRRHDRARLHAVIENARAQARGERS